MQLLEPVADVIVTVPDDAVGGVLAELFGYASRLRSRTQGRGTFTARPAGYAPAPPG
jgi:elongation factor G